MNVLEAIREIHLGSSLTDYANMINNELELIVKKNKKEVSKLLEIVEDFELNIAISSNDYSWEMALLHILCYFINGDFDNLRFLIKRLKAEIKNRKEVSIVIETFSSIWKKNFVNGFLSLQKSMIYYQNNENIYVLLTLLNDSMLTNFKQHILRNFSIINFRDLQTMSGLSEKCLEEFCLKNHWKKQKENGEINLKDQFDNSKMPEVLEKQVGQLTEMVSFMEKLN